MCIPDWDWYQGTTKAVASKIFALPVTATAKIVSKELRHRGLA
jgi:hypothetical protein